MRSALERLWLMKALVPSALYATTFPVTSPATLKVSLPWPPSRTVITLGSVLRTQKLSFPPRPSTSTFSTFVYWTLRPAPMTPSFVITKLSLASVPMTTTVSKPGPPSMPTGALMLYSMWSSPLPPLTSVSEVATELVLTMMNARTTKVSLPSSPKSFSDALLL